MGNIITGQAVRQVFDLEKIEELRNAIDANDNDITNLQNIKADVIINTVSGDIATFSDGADNMLIKHLVADIEPVQDLHGYDYPWPAGGGKNLCPLPAGPITSNGVTFTPNADGSITISGSANASAAMYYALTDIPSGSRVTFSLNNDSVNAEVGVRLISTTDGGTGTLWGTSVLADAVNKTQFVTTTFDAKSINIFVKSNHGAVDITLKVMIELGSTASAFEPYANICPISGWTGLAGKRTGGNVANINVFYASSTNTQITKDPASGSITVVNTSAERYCGISAWRGGIIALRPFPKGVYTVSFDIAGTITTGWTAGVRSIETSVFDATERVAFSSPGHYSFTFDSSAWTYDKYLSIFRTGNETSDVNVTISNLTIVPGAAEGSFEPYVAQNISVNWQDQAGTVYGGTVDVVTGELTVNATKISTPAANGTDSQNLLYTLYRSLSPESTASTTSAQKAKSNIGTFIGLSQARASEVPCFTQVETTLYARIPSASTVAEATQWLSDNNVEIWYPLRDHQTYQLTPQEVTTLLGNNTVYVDCGSVSVDYPADTGIVVAEQSNAIEQKQDATNYVTLSGTIVTQTGADNTMYLCGELAELTFTAPATGQTAIRFSSGTTPTVATFSGVTWLNGFDPSAIEASKTYEINILNGLGCAAWT